MDDQRFSVKSELLDNYEDYYVGGATEWRWLSAQAKADNVVTLCGDKRNQSVLEVGSGDGSILQRLSDLEFSKTFFSVEISNSAVEAIRMRNIPGVAECKLFDGYNIPYEDNRFGLVILSHVVEHVEYPRRLIYEASRVADQVFIEVPLEDNARLKEDFVFDSTGHINFYNRKTIRQLVQSCGLRVLDQRTTNSSLAVYRFANGWKAPAKYLPKQVLLKLSPRLATSLWTYHCALLCER